MTPIVSVCVITYNQAPYIGQTLEGILMQQCNFPFEIVIGEDFSNDSTRSICEEYAVKYPEVIRLLPSESNLGDMANFIRTMQSCTGKYIAVCEGDDYWTDPLKIKKQIDFLEANVNCSACFTNAEVFNEIENTKRRYLNGLKEGYIPARTVFRRGGALYPTASILFRKSLLKFDIFYSIKELAGDTLLIINMAMAGDIFYMDHITCVYRVWTGGIYSSVMWDPAKTLERKKKIVAGFKKLMKVSGRPFRKFQKERISTESLYILENDRIYINLDSLLRLNLRDLIRLLIFKLKK